MSCSGRLARRLTCKIKSHLLKSAVTNAQKNRKINQNIFTIANICATIFAMSYTLEDRAAIDGTSNGGRIAMQGGYDVSEVG
jgi:hypothetical protein